MRPQTAKRSWFAFQAPRPDARLRLFCFPFAGGGASFYRPWIERLSPDVHVHPVQLPGRETRLREHAFDRLEPLIARLADALGAHLDRPFALFGHSMGALIAFELARELRRRQAPAPVRLLVSGHPAPQLPRRESTRYALPEPELVAELQRLGGTPPEVLAHPELMQLVLPLLRADFAVVETYAFRDAPPLDCPITAFGGTDDENAGEAQLEPWHAQTRGPFVLYMFPGGHFYLNDAADAVIQLVARDLEQALQR